MLKIGTKAPNFELPNAEGQTINLSDYKGRKVFLWFFPKANTPGCTAEGCSLRDEYSRFKDKGIEVIGMSADSPKRQKKFVERYAFPYPMLCDEQMATLKAYDGWGRKKFMGREYDGIHRISYLIDEHGNIERAWTSVKTKTHAVDVLDEIGD